MEVTHIRVIVLFGFLLISVAVCVSDHNPCTGEKAKLGENCDKTDDCELSEGVICKKGKCECHQFYEEVQGEDEDLAKICRKLPSVVGATCTDSCRSPMRCEDEKCTCEGDNKKELESGECVFGSELGEYCTNAKQCAIPFSTCLRRKCTCKSGSEKSDDGKTCLPEKHCPLGGDASEICIRKVATREEGENLVTHNFRISSNNCTRGFYCVTPEGSPFGHCCPITCPLATEPIRELSCDPKARRKCPSDTHFCHRVSGPGYAFAACCKRPCPADAHKSLFLITTSRSNTSQNCYPRSHLDSECSVSEQCDGGQAMKCKRGVCQCNRGYTAQVDSIFSTSGEVEHNIPAQVCRKNCKKPELSRDTKCHSEARLGRKCRVQHQCKIEGAGCFRGKCRCKCGFQKKRNKCVPKPPDDESTTTTTTTTTTTRRPTTSRRRNTTRKPTTARTRSGGGAKNSRGRGFGSILRSLIESG